MGKHFSRIMSWTTTYIADSFNSFLERVQPALLPIVESNLIPDFILRWGIRRSLGDRLAELRALSDEEEAKRSAQFVQSLKNLPIAVNTSDANEQHYEVPSAFYRVVLGPRLKYSSCFYPKPDSSLGEAEEAMLQQYVERAGVQDSMKVMDLGCGWGSVSLYVAEKFPNAKITAVSNSATQREYIESVCREKGFKNVKVITCDINSFEVDEPGTFDRVISIEMFEHMKNYQKLMKKVAGFLKPSGKLFVHIFTHKKYSYHFDEGWMAKTFFTGGTMPSEDLLLNFQDDLKIASRWKVNGTHYQKTLDAWLALLDKNSARLKPLFTETYGRGNERKWLVNWRLFFLACSELFGYDEGQEWYVSHYLFEKA